MQGVRTLDWLINISNSDLLMLTETERLYTKIQTELKKKHLGHFKGISSISWQTVMYKVRLLRCLFLTPPPGLLSSPPMPAMLLNYSQHDFLLLPKHAWHNVWLFSFLMVTPTWNGPHFWHSAPSTVFHEAFEGESQTVSSFSLQPLHSNHPYFTGLCRLNDLMSLKHLAQSLAHSTSSTNGSYYYYSSIR